MAAQPSASERNIIDPDEYVALGYPHEVWTRLRRESPVSWWDRTRGVPFWAITKQEDILTISRRPEEFVSSVRLGVSNEPEPPRDDRFPPTLIGMDPPKHGPYRQLVMKRFTPAAIRRYHPDVERIAKEIVDDLIERDRSGECDFVKAVSAPLPIAVIAWMLGVPREDWQMLFDWTNRTIGAGDPEYQEEGKTPQETARGAMIELFQYFSRLVEEKKKHPRDDMVTLFSQLEFDGKPLPLMDVLAWAFLIVIAGNETTRNATSGGMLAFIEHQDQLRKLQRDPALLDSAVEEVLRWTSPIIHFARTATQDFELRGHKIRKGQSVAMFYPSANRDEDVFEEPFSFRIDRRPNRHLAFGVGEHFCLGAHLARLELRVAYKHLLHRIEEVELAGPVERLRSTLVGGVKHLPIRYKIRAA